MKLCGERKSRGFARSVTCFDTSADLLSLSRKVADVYLGEHLLENETSTIEPSRGDFPDPSPFAGKYVDPRSHEIVSFTVSNENLMAWGGTSDI
jgi:hypothetical protein